MVGSELGKVYTKVSFSTTHDNVLNFGILCTNLTRNNQNDSCFRSSEFH